MFRTDWPKITKKEVAVGGIKLGNACISEKGEHFCFFSFLQIASFPKAMSHCPSSVCIFKERTRDAYWM